MRPFFRGFLCLGALMSPVMAEFVPPAEGPVPFRRDRLPLDVDTMASLSRQVTAFTPTAARNPAGQRAVAQMTALALALDPANREARALIQTMAGGGAPEPAVQEELERARNRAWQALAWLEMPEAGADGQALAACLGDVLAVADPQHPKAAERLTAGEKGAWKDWVAEESAFRVKKVAEPMKTDVPVVPDTTAPALALSEVEGSIPMWYLDKQLDQMKLAAVPVRLLAKPKEKADAAFSLVLEGDAESNLLAKSFRQVEAAMRLRHGTLPKGLEVHLQCGNKAAYSVARNGQAMSGTAALLLDGALSGKVPTATALAVVGEGGKLELPPKFWQTLRTLSPLPGGRRLILPAAAADYLTALVTLDDAAFFMKNEVLLAATVDELCDLASGAPKPEIADGLKRFEDIQKVGQGKTLGTFLAHSATQQRLKELSAVMPVHASARLLALQGSGNRPRFLERSILAKEIRTALEPTGYLRDTTTSQLDPDRLDQAHEASRKQLDALANYIDIRDRDLHKVAVEMADGLRSLARLLQKKDDLYSNVSQKQLVATRDTIREHARVLGLVTEAAGDAADFPPPKVPALPRDE